MKSVYSFPSASQTWEPAPRSRNTGAGEYTAAPREGELTPSISDFWASSNNCSEGVEVRTLVGVRNALINRETRADICCVLAEGLAVAQAGGCFAVVRELENAALVCTIGTASCTRRRRLGCDSIVQRIASCQSEDVALFRAFGQIRINRRSGAFTGRFRVCGSKLGERAGISGMFAV